MNLEQYISQQSGKLTIKRERHHKAIDKFITVNYLFSKVYHLFLYLNQLYISIPQEYSIYKENNIFIIGITQIQEAIATYISKWEYMPIFISVY